MDSSATDIIKSYLVELGYTVNAEGEKKFDKALASTTKHFAGVATGAAAASLAIEAMVMKATEQMEDLYYAGQRTASTVEALSNFQYSAKQVGVDAGAATAQVAALASSIRYNPGSTTILQNLGISLKDANGKMRDTTELAELLAKTLGSMADRGTVFQRAIAKEYSNMFGVDIEQLRMLSRNMQKFDDAQKDRSGRLKDAGLDPDKAAADFAKFGQDWRRLGDEMDIVFTKIAHDFLEPVDWAVNHLETALEWFAKLDHQTEDWFKDLTGVKVTLGEISTVITSIVGGLTAAAAIKGIGGALFGAGGAAKAAAGAVGAAGGASAAGAAAGGVAATGFRYAMGGAAETAEGSAMARVAARAAAGEATGNIAGLLTRIGGPLAIAYTALRADPAGAHEEADLAKYRAGGEPLEKRAMDHYAQKGVDPATASAIVANLQRESKLNTSAVGDNGNAYGLEQWHPDRQAEFKRFSGKDIHTSNFEEQLDFVLHEMATTEKNRIAGLDNQSSAGDKAAFLSRNMVRPKDDDGEKANSRAALATSIFDKYGAPLAPSPGQQQALTVKVEQKTNINILPGSNASDTATKIAGEQERVNGNMVRNISSAVQ